MAHAEDIDGVDFHAFAEIAAELDVTPSAAARILADRGIPDRAKLDSILQQWRERVSADRSLSRTYRLYYSHHLERFTAEQARRGAVPLESGPPPVNTATPPAAPPPTPTLPANPIKSPPRAALQGTSLDLGYRGPVLPFTAAAPGSAPAMRAPAATLAAVSQTNGPARASLTGTSLALDVPRGAPLPFAGSNARPDRPSSGDRPPDPAVVPSVGHRPPTFTLEQHASLHVELDLYPDRQAQTLVRYGLTGDTKTAIDLQMTTQMARDPAWHERWNQAYQTYRAWLESERARR